jgi:hypothetical protein
MRFVPAVRSYSRRRLADGALQYVVSKQHFTHGVLNNPGDMQVGDQVPIPALSIFTPTIYPGTRFDPEFVSYRAYMRNGVPDNVVYAGEIMSAIYERHVEISHVRRTVEQVREYYTAGRLTDPVINMPAVQRSFVEPRTGEIFVSTTHYLNDQKHCEYAPATVTDRLTPPALTMTREVERYYLHDTELTHQEWLRRTRRTRQIRSLPSRLRSQLPLTERGGSSALTVDAV